jgi:AraC-like DNA-binding protein
MTPDELTKPTVPLAYVLLTLQLAAERGVGRDAMLKDLDIGPELLEQPDTRIGLLRYGRLCLRALALTNEPALGYEFGLRNNLTTHGFYGFGVMSQTTVRDSLEFAVRFASLRMPGWTLRLFTEGDRGVVEAREAVPFGILRQYALDMMLISLFKSHQPFMAAPESTELWFDCEEPAYYARYRDQLPRVRFSAGANQIRFPAEWLTRPLTTANAVTARLVARECERELALLGHTEDLLERVRATLVNDRGRYPDLATVAKRLYMSDRTLKRRLQKHSISFQQLLDEARKRDSIRLLEDPTLNLEEIAERLGYSASANFARAFRKWTGHSPGDFRARFGTGR